MPPQRLLSDGDIMTTIRECPDRRVPRLLTKAGSEVPLVTATPAQSQLTGSLSGSCNAGGTPKTNLSAGEPGALVKTIPIEVVRTTFDYGSLSPEFAEALRGHTRRIRDQVRATTGAIILVGYHLLAAKQMLGHGQFIHWLKTECGFSVSSAENYIRVCEFTEHDDRFPTVTILPPATLYLISAKNAPPEVVQAVVARAAGGEPVPAAEVKRMFRDFKSRNRKETQSKRREQAKKAIAKANAQAIVKQFGRDGAVFLLGMRDNILETLSFLDQEIGVSHRLNQRVLLPTVS
jgi:hypothetical protein